MPVFSTLLLQVSGAPTSVSVDGLISDLSKQGPLISIFLLICLYLVYQIFNKDKQINELNEYIRSSDKENMSLYKDVANTLDQVFERQKEDRDMIIKEISNLKDWINMNKPSK